ncbi:allophanate hydrolase [Zymobacter palmae]|uniref:Asp-tRNA(Asn)/Glu-tRNA(Gln) amidotransferase A n=1 Tax=Zymobacter palmae TaxID=33074 RepID=A0A348HC33_9GAMM|nr:allophanate hydrolase [Zymobacter palmae]BBG29185.1 asp-tRNA(Asn)/Glu-tRNA(Gln) amidotransferase A [Zymobacter palmae]
MHDHQWKDLISYQCAYASGIEPVNVLSALHERITQRADDPTWISLFPLDDILAMLAVAAQRKQQGETLPLYGIPFGVKDNIDVAGLPTTAGCPEFAYMPQQHAVVVQKLIAAGAIPIGKTNLDQFATGLNGTRTPYGIPRCAFDDRYISGGSSSGSAISVASNTVPFALGTDTAGSGRVPAALNNLVGLKPTKGLLSTTGLVPAVRSQDCITVFAHSVDDALTVSRIAAGFDSSDIYSRQAPPHSLAECVWPTHFNFGIPDKKQLQFFGDTEAEALFEAAIQRLERLGGNAVTFDYTPFQQAAKLLYAGPWVAERLAALHTFATHNADALNPVVRDIILSAEGISAVDTFNGFYQLAHHIRTAERTWSNIDIMVLPTAPTTYTVEQMLANPVQLNSNLGVYTNFVNLMDLSAIAVPAGFRTNGLPFGITMIGQAFQDGTIASLGKAFMKEELTTACHHVCAAESERVEVAVVGAHLSGQPLNAQLTERKAILKETAHTASGYALYALSDMMPEKPGLIRDPNAAGHIEVEVWTLPLTKFGSFITDITAPLGIGTITLDDGRQVKGFLCEPHAVTGAVDITHYGGWRAYCADRH